MSAPFVQMMTMYDYGAEKHYENRPAPARSKLAQIDAIDLEAMKTRVAEAMRRNGMN